jgi:DNA modification methylase
VIAEPLRSLARPIGEFRLLGGNPRRGDVASVKRSLQRFGQRKPIVVRSDGTVEAGNTTLKAALELGWAEIAAVPFADDEATAKAFALADNRTSELGAFDLAALAAMAVEVQAADPGLLEAASFTEADLNALLAGQRVPPKLNDPDDVPEPPGKPVTVPGDVWLLGPHRLLCGDATDMAAVEAMLGGDRCDCMWTDPPYGVDYEGCAGTISNDDAAGLPALLAGAFAVATAALKASAPVYIAYPARHRQTFDQEMLGAGWRYSQELIWVKDSLVLGRGDYHYRHEGVLFGYTGGSGTRRGRGKGWFGDDAQTSVFEVPKPRASEQHPTMKPVALVVQMLANSCPPGGLVYEPFGGSGSTLIAAHQTWRQARAVELDPAYCDVICRRFQEHTGCKPVLEATGAPHDFTAPRPS